MSQLAQTLRQPVAVHVWHVNVTQYDIDMVAAEHVERIHAVLRRFGLIAQRAELFRQQHAVNRMVINDQHHDVFIAGGLLRHRQFQRGRRFTVDGNAINPAQQQRQIVQRRAAVHPLSRRRFLRHINVFTADTDARAYRLRWRVVVIADHHIVRPSPPLIVRDLDALLLKQTQQEGRQIVVAQVKPDGFFLQTIQQRRRGLLSGVDRNTHHELAAHARFRVDFDVTIHHVDELFTDRQSQPGALEITLHAGADLEERVEQARDLFRRDSHAGVAHAKRQIPLFHIGVQDNAAGVGELDGVVQQVGDHLLQAQRIAIQRQRHIVLDEHIQRQALAHHQRQIVAGNMVDHLTRREGTRLNLQLLGLDLREVENIADDFQQQAG